MAHCAQGVYIHNMFADSDSAGMTLYIYIYIYMYMNAYAFGVIECDGQTLYVSLQVAFCCFGLLRVAGWI